MLCRSHGDGSRARRGGVKEFLINQGDGRREDKRRGSGALEGNKAPSDRRETQRQIQARGKMAGSDK